MTDEEKAEEYFCEHCENSFEHDNGHCSNCSKWDYFIAGLAEGKPKWHDLRKDPKDLPKVKGYYLVCGQNAQESSISYFNHSEMDFNDIVIAWCELPKFEETNL